MILRSINTATSVLNSRCSILIFVTSCTKKNNITTTASILNSHCSVLFVTSWMSIGIPVVDSVVITMHILIQPYLLISYVVRPGRFLCCTFLWCPRQMPLLMVMKLFRAYQGISIGPVVRILSFRHGLFLRMDEIFYVIRIIRETKFERRSNWKNVLSNSGSVLSRASQKCVAWTKTSKNWPSSDDLGKKGKISAFTWGVD